MKIALYILAVLAFGVSGFIATRVVSAVHEIEMLMLCLIGAVFLVGAVITGALNLEQGGEVDHRRDMTSEPLLDPWFFAFVVILLAGIGAYFSLGYFEGGLR